MELETKMERSDSRVGSDTLLVLQSEVRMKKMRQKLYEQEQTGMDELYEECR